MEGVEQYSDYQESHHNDNHNHNTPSWSSDDNKQFDNQTEAYNAHHHPNYHHAPANSFPLSGRKRHFSQSSSDHIDGGSSVKLYVEGIPRTITEQDVRSLFGTHGNIVEVVLLKDKRTGQQHEYCFVKYAKLEEAEQAIGTLNNQHIFPGAMLPIKVKYADAERERFGPFGPHIFKLYVACLNKQASQREIEELFSPYGHVQDVYILRDEMRQSRGCAFVQYYQREMAVVAINALNGTYMMRGCDQPLIVRFADPKKPKAVESRGFSKFGGSCFGPCPQESVVRPAPFVSEPMGWQMLPNASHPSSQSGTEPPTVSSTTAVSESVLPSTSSAPAVPISTEAADCIDCDWSEHFCPDGNKYYYNCATCESRWEKPEEYAFYEQQLQNSQPSQHFPFQQQQVPQMQQV